MKYFEQLDEIIVSSCYVLTDRQNHCSGCLMSGLLYSNAMQNRHNSYTDRLEKFLQQYVKPLKERKDVFTSLDLRLQSLVSLFIKMRTELEEARATDISQVPAVIHASLESIRMRYTEWVRSHHFFEKEFRELLLDKRFRQKVKRIATSYPLTEYKEHNQSQSSIEEETLYGVLRLPVDHVGTLKALSEQLKTQLDQSSNAAAFEEVTSLAKALTEIHEEVENALIWNQRKGVLLDWEETVCTPSGEYVSLVSQSRYIVKEEQFVLPSDASSIHSRLRLCEGTSSEHVRDASMGKQATESDQNPQECWIRALLCTDVLLILKSVQQMPGLSEALFGSKKKRSGDKPEHNGKQWVLVGVIPFCKELQVNYSIEKGILAVRLPLLRSMKLIQEKLSQILPSEDSRYQSASDMESDKETVTTKSSSRSSSVQSKTVAVLQSCDDSLLRIWCTTMKELSSSAVSVLDEVDKETRVRSVSSIGRQPSRRQMRKSYSDESKTKKTKKSKTLSRAHSDLGLDQVAFGVENLNVKVLTNECSLLLVQKLMSDDALKPLGKRELSSLCYSAPPKRSSYPVRAGYVLKKGGRGFQRWDVRYLELRLNGFPRPIPGLTPGLTLKEAARCLVDLSLQENGAAKWKPTVPSVYGSLLYFPSSDYMKTGEMPKGRIDLHQILKVEANRRDVNKFTIVTESKAYEFQIDSSVVNSQHLPIDFFPFESENSTVASLAKDFRNPTQPADAVKSWLVSISSALYLKKRLKKLQDALDRVLIDLQMFGDDEALEGHHSDLNEGNNSAEAKPEQGVDTPVTTEVSASVDTYSEVSPEDSHNDPGRNSEEHINKAERETKETDETPKQEKKIIKKKRLFSKKGAVSQNYEQKNSRNRSETNLTAIRRLSRPDARPIASASDTIRKFQTLYSGKTHRSKSRNNQTNEDDRELDGIKPLLADVDLQVELPRNDENRKIATLFEQITRSTEHSGLQGEKCIPFMEMMYMTDDWNGCENVWKKIVNAHLNEREKVILFDSSSAVSTAAYAASVAMLTAGKRRLFRRSMQICSDYQSLTTGTDEDVSGSRYLGLVNSLIMARHGYLHQVLSSQQRTLQNNSCETTLDRQLRFFLLIMAVANGDVPRNAISGVEHVILNMIRNNVEMCFEHFLILLKSYSACNNWTAFVLLHDALWCVCSLLSPGEEQNGLSKLTKVWDARFRWAATFLQQHDIADDGKLALNESLLPEILKLLISRDSHAPAHLDKYRTEGSEGIKMTLPKSWRSVLLIHLSHAMAFCGHYKILEHFMELLSNISHVHGLDEGLQSLRSTQAILLYSDIDILKYFGRDELYCLPSVEEKAVHLLQHCVLDGLASAGRFENTLSFMNSYCCVPCLMATCTFWQPPYENFLSAGRGCSFKDILERISTEYLDNQHLFKNVNLRFDSGSTEIDCQPRIIKQLQHLWMSYLAGVSAGGKVEIKVSESSPDRYTFKMSLREANTHTLDVAIGSGVQHQDQQLVGNTVKLYIEFLIQPCVSTFGSVLRMYSESDSKKKWEFVCQVCNQLSRIGGNGYYPVPNVQNDIHRLLKLLTISPAQQLRLRGEIGTKMVDAYVQGDRIDEAERVLSCVENSTPTRQELITKSYRSISFARSNSWSHREMESFLHSAEESVHLNRLWALPEQSSSNVIAWIYCGLLRNNSSSKNPMLQLLQSTSAGISVSGIYKSLVTQYSLKGKVDATHSMYKNLSRISHNRAVSNLMNDCEDSDTLRNTICKARFPDETSGAEMELDSMEDETVRRYSQIVSRKRKEHGSGELSAYTPTDSEMCWSTILDQYVNKDVLESVIKEGRLPSPPLLGAYILTNSRRGRGFGIHSFLRQLISTVDDKTKDHDVCDSLLRDGKLICTLFVNYALEGRPDKVCLYWLLFIRLNIESLKFKPQSKNSSDAILESVNVLLGNDERISPFASFFLFCVFVSLEFLGAQGKLLVDNDSQIDEPENDLLERFCSGTLLLPSETNSKFTSFSEVQIVVHKTMLAVLETGSCHAIGLLSATRVVDPENSRGTFEHVWECLESECNVEEWDKFKSSSSSVLYCLLIGRQRVATRDVFSCLQDTLLQYFEQSELTSLPNHLNKLLVEDLLRNCKDVWSDVESIQLTTAVVSSLMQGKWYDALDILMNKGGGSMPTIESVTLLLYVLCDPFSKSTSQRSDISRLEEHVLLVQERLFENDVSLRELDISLLVFVIASTGEFQYAEDSLCRYYQTVNGFLDEGMNNVEILKQYAPNHVLCCMLQGALLSDKADEADSSLESLIHNILDAFKYPIHKALEEVVMTAHNLIDKELSNVSGSTDKFTRIVFRGMISTGYFYCQKMDLSSYGHYRLILERLLHYMPYLPSTGKLTLAKSCSRELISLLELNEKSFAKPAKCNTSYSAGKVEVAPVSLSQTDGVSGISRKYAKVDETFYSAVVKRQITNQPRHIEKKTIQQPHMESASVSYQPDRAAKAGNKDVGIGRKVTMQKGKTDILRTCKAKLGADEFESAFSMDNIESVNGEVSSYFAHFQDSSSADSTASYQSNAANFSTAGVGAPVTSGKDQLLGGRLSVASLRKKLKHSQLSLQNKIENNPRRKAVHSARKDEVNRGDATLPSFHRRLDDYRWSKNNIDGRRVKGEGSSTTLAGSYSKSDKDEVNEGDVTLLSSHRRLDYYTNNLNGSRVKDRDSSVILARSNSNSDYTIQQQTHKGRSSECDVSGSYRDFSEPMGREFIYNDTTLSSKHDIAGRQTTRADGNGRSGSVDLAERLQPANDVNSASISAVSVANGDKVTFMNCQTIPTSSGDLHDRSEEYNGSIYDDSSVQFAHREDRKGVHESRKKSSDLDIENDNELQVAASSFPNDYGHVINDSSFPSMNMNKDEQEIISRVGGESLESAIDNMLKIFDKASEEMDTTSLIDLRWLSSTDLTSPPERSAAKPLIMLRTPLMQSLLLHRECLLRTLDVQAFQEQVYALFEAAAASQHHVLSRRFSNPSRMNNRNLRKFFGFLTRLFRQHAKNCEVLESELLEQRDVWANDEQLSYIEPLSRQVARLDIFNEAQRGKLVQYSGSSSNSRGFPFTNVLLQLETEFHDHRKVLSQICREWKYKVGVVRYVLPVLLNNNELWLEERERNFYHLKEQLEAMKQLELSVMESTSQLQAEMEELRRQFSKYKNLSVRAEKHLSSSHSPSSSIKSPREYDRLIAEARQRGKERAFAELESEGYSVRVPKDYSGCGQSELLNLSKHSVEDEIRSERCRLDALKDKKKQLNHQIEVEYSLNTSLNNQIGVLESRRITCPIEDRLFSDVEARLETEATLWGHFRSYLPRLSQEQVQDVRTIYEEELDNLSHYAPLMF